MSTDVERTVRGLIDLHEMWANVIQVAIATWLIEIELGAACIGPVVVALGKSATIETNILVITAEYCSSGNRDYNLVLQIHDILPAPVDKEGRREDW
jgi:hypothetical protein